MLEVFKGLRVSRKQFGHCGLCLQKELKTGHDGTDPRRWKLGGQELKVIPSYMTGSRPAWAIKNLKGTEIVLQDPGLLSREGFYTRVTVIGGVAP